MRVNQIAHAPLPAMRPHLADVYPALTFEAQEHDRSVVHVNSQWRHLHSFRAEFAGARNNGKEKARPAWWAGAGEGAIAAPEGDR